MLLNMCDSCSNKYRICLCDSCEDGLFYKSNKTSEIENEPNSWEIEDMYNNENREKVVNKI